MIITHFVSFPANFITASTLYMYGGRCTYMICYNLKLLPRCDGVLDGCEGNEDEKDCDIPGKLWQ